MSMNQEKWSFRGDKSMSRTVKFPNKKVVEK